MPGEGYSSGATSLAWPLLLAPLYKLGLHDLSLAWGAWALGTLAHAGVAVEAARLTAPLAGRAAALGAAAPLLRATEGQSTPCWGGNTFIDHILAGGAARGWVVPDSLRVLVYRETGAAARALLPDHCPVSVRLRLPD